MPITEPQARGSRPPTRLPSTHPASRGIINGDQVEIPPSPVVRGSTTTRPRTPGTWQNMAFLILEAAAGAPLPPCPEEPLGAVYGQF
eukprot:2911736-Pyramimonas_sp.AAC.1